MKLGARKAQQQQLMVVTDLAAGPGYTFEAGEILAIKGPVPSALATHVTRFDGQVLDGRLVRQIDSAQFERDTADEARRQSAPPSRADRNLTAAEIVSEVLHGDTDAFERVGALGFPRSFGQRVKGSRLETLWRERDVRQWAEGISIVAAALAR